MATLYDTDRDPRDRTTWLWYTVEFLRRALALVGPLDVHGPHGPGGEWGTAVCTTLGGARLEVVFRCQAYRKGLQIRDDPKNCHKPRRYPLRAECLLPAHAAIRLERARHELESWQRTHRRGP